MSGCENSGVPLASLGWENLESVLLPARSGVVTAFSGMVHWFAEDIIWSPGFTWWFPASSRLSLSDLLHSTIIYDNNVKSSLSICACNQHEVAASKAFTMYCIHRVLHTPCIAFPDYFIHQVLHHPQIDRLPLPAILSSLGGPCCTQLYTLTYLPVNQIIECQLPLRLPPDLSPPDRLPPSNHESQ